MTGCVRQGFLARPVTPVPGRTRFQRGSMSMEYAVFIVVVVSAIVGMAVYTKRALCGRWRTVGDVFGYGRLYEPGRTTVTKSITISR